MDHEYTLVLEVLHFVEYATGLKTRKKNTLVTDIVGAVKNERNLTELLQICSMH